MAKEELPKNLFETICAFLNRNGGLILLGVNDDKTIEGINPSKADDFCKNIISLSNNSEKLFPTFLIDTKMSNIKEKLSYAFLSQFHHKFTNAIIKYLTEELMVILK
jgi:ATP-dependent DNA helicase RecG